MRTSAVRLRFRLIARASSGPRYSSTTQGGQPIALGDGARNSATKSPTGPSDCDRWGWPPSPHWAVPSHQRSLFDDEVGINPRQHPSSCDGFLAATSTSRSFSYQPIRFDRNLRPEQGLRLLRLSELFDPALDVDAARRTRRGRKHRSGPAPASVGALLVRRSPNYQPADLVAAAANLANPLNRRVAPARHLGISQRAQWTLAKRPQKVHVVELARDPP